MAKSREGERGLSLIEALVIVTITALLALMLLPMVSRAAARNFGMTEQAVDARLATSAETEFRALLAGAVIRVNPAESAIAVSGERQSVTFLAALPAAGCGDVGVSVVRLRATSAGLVCETAGRRREILNWRGGDARFSYSADGARWRETWSGAEAPLVRFELTQPRQRTLIWVARAGATPAPQFVDAP